MAALVCDLCGGKLIMGAGGIATCESCGMEHSADRMKEKVQEIKGTVRVDNSHMIENYFKMAENALDASNNEEADNYCNKIIEIDPLNYRAWFIKGKAVGWQSTLGNPRISETINAFTNALDNCPEEEKESLGIDCKTEIENLHKALLTVRMQNFMNHPDQNDINNLTNDIKGILVNTVSFLSKAGINATLFGKDLGSAVLTPIINNFNAKIWREYQGDDGKPGDYEFKRFMSETDYCIQALTLATTLFGTDDTDDLELYEYRALTYDAMVKFNTMVRDACSWDYNIYSWGKSYYKNLTLNSSAVSARNTQNREWEAKAREWRSKKIQKENSIKAEKERKAKEEAQKRFDAYWAEHAEQKASLESEKKDLSSQISALNASSNDQVAVLNKEISAIPGKTEIDNIEERIKKLTEEKSALGIFKGKEKKALQEQIDQANAEKKGVQDRMDAAKKEIEAKIANVKAEIQKKVTPLQNRVNTISNELTKAR